MFAHAQKFDQYQIILIKSNILGLKSIMIPEKMIQALFLCPPRSWTPSTPQRHFSFAPAVPERHVPFHNVFRWFEEMTRSCDGVAMVAVPFFMCAKLLESYMDVSTMVTWKLSWMST
jgi:hypothetical protein